MKDQQQPICYNCKNRTPTKTNSFVCRAFPKGIPEKILDNIWDHRGPVPGDNGIRFEAIEAATPAPDFGPQGQGVAV